MSGHVIFELGGRRYAAPVAHVREVVRLRTLATLPAMAPGTAGVLDLRGRPLPVVDLRTADAERGDVLVLRAAGGAVGAAVDRVLAVVETGRLQPAAGAASALARAGAGALPDYVLDVLRDVTDDVGQVFAVDLVAMLESVRLSA